MAIISLFFKIVRISGVTAESFKRCVSGLELIYRRKNITLVPIRSGDLAKAHAVKCDLSFK